SGTVDETKTNGGWNWTHSPETSPWGIPPPPPRQFGVEQAPKGGPPRRLVTSLIAIAALVGLITGGIGTVLILRASTGVRDATLGLPNPPVARAARSSPASPVTPLPSALPPVKPDRWILARGGLFRGEGVSFSYPQEWISLTDAATHLPEGELKWATAVGNNGSDMVAVGGYAYPGGRPDAAGRRAIAGQVLDAMEHHMQASHTFQDVSGTEVGGLPGYTFAIAGSLPDVAFPEDTAFVLFGAHQFYVIDARMNSFTEDQVFLGLSFVVHTFRVD
ncbi:MAG: hypothetical protein M3P01_11165, partial [Actinomycetota bacterium]|nr:hypothetical protein [Actinomycetota bacterium]